MGNNNYKEFLAVTISSLRKFTPHFLATGVMILGLSLAFFLFQQIKLTLHQTSNDEMELALHLTDKEFSQDTERAIALTRSTAALFKIHPQTDAASFHHFHGKLSAELFSQGLQAIAWVPMVDRQQKEIFEQNINSDTTRTMQGYPNFKVISPRINQDEKLAPISLIEPSQYKEKLHGLNIWAIPEVRKTLEQSLKSNLLLNASLINTNTALAAFDSKELPGTTDRIILISSPVFQNGDDRSLENLTGFIIGFYRIGNYVMNPLPAKMNDRLKLEVYSVDQGAPEKSRLVYAKSPNLTGSEKILATRSQLAELGDQLWRFDVAILEPELIEIALLPAVIFSSATILAMLMAFLVFRIASQSQYLETRVAERSAELMLLNKHLKQSKQEAEAASYAKSRFLANMSHELRTPLNAIIGFVQMLLGEYYGRLTDDRQKEALTDIGRSGEELLALVNNILDHTKLEVGTFHIQLENVDTQEAVQSVLTKMKRRALDKKIQLSVNYPENVPNPYADSLALRQVLSNLVDNSLKFTPSGGAISIQVDKNTETGMIDFKVVDTGKGVTQEEANRIFEPFIQAEDTMTKKHEGAGLGLSIVRQLVHSMNGKVGLRSRLGHGTTISFSLPPAKEGQETKSTHHIMAAE